MLSARIRQYSTKVMHEPQDVVQYSLLGLEGKKSALYLYLHFVSYHILCFLYFVYIIGYKVNCNIL